MRILVCLFICVVCLTGCTAKSVVTVPDNDGKRNPATITLTPVDLFEGNATKFKPFLGSMSGAFKLSFKGDKPIANLVIDLWEKGEKVSSLGSIGDLFFSPNDQFAREIEVIISIDTISIEDQENLNQIKIGLVHDSGSSLYTFSNLSDESLGTKGLMISNMPRTFTAEDAVYVWGMQATSTNSIRTLDFSPESLSKLEWGIIFSLNFEEA